MKRIILVSFAALLIMASFANAQNQPKAQIKLQAVVEKDIEIVNEQGEKEIQRVEAAKVVPGDEVIYTINYSHVGNEAAENVLITNPIPEHMVYVNESADGENCEITFSIDGGNTFNSSINLFVINAEGNSIAATAVDYTHVRWMIVDRIMPGHKGSVSFKAQLK